MYSALSMKSAYDYVNSLFKESNNNFLLDPLSCIIRLSILCFKPSGTKISITRNRISYNEPCVLQGTIRWTQGDNREDLHNLFKPIQKSIEWYSTEDKNLKNIFALSVGGLNKLKSAYGENTIITHSIDRYISIIQTGNIIEQPVNTRSNREVTNHIFEELKQLWHPREISVVNNLLLQIKDNYENKSRELTIPLIESLETILNMKEQYVHDLILKTTTVLE
jgi:hypothetical protein